MIKLLRMVVLLLSLDVLLTAQQSEATAQRPAAAAQQSAAVIGKICAFAEIYKSDGWTIPGLAGSKEAIIRKDEVQIPGVAATQPRTARASLSGMPGVFATRLEPGYSDVQVDFPYCSADQEGRLVLQSTTAKVTQLWRFDFSGKVFAYGVVYVSPNPSLSSVRVFFYDPDGAGRFSVAKYPKMFFASLELPGWVR